MLVAAPPSLHKHHVQKIIFDVRRRAIGLARAAPSTRDNFLLNRAFEDAVERIATMDPAPHRIAIIGRCAPDWIKALSQFCGVVELLDPTALESGDPKRIAGDASISRSIDRYSLVLSIGLLDHCNDPRLAAFIVTQIMQHGGKLIGSIVGGDSLAHLRTAILDIDRADGKAAPRFHPLMDGSSVAGLLFDAGLSAPVVDVDRLKVRYRDLRHLVSDLRVLGCGRSLATRPAFLSPSRWQKALRQTSGEGVVESFDLINFTATKKDGERFSNLPAE
jgi:hypothetical protein